MHYLLPSFKWFDKSWIGTFIADSRWLFPAIEAVHIVALCLLFGALLMLNLRLLGLSLTEKPVRQLARELAPWVFCSLVIILVTGVLLFSSEALNSYQSVPVQVKMLFLFAAMIFTTPSIAASPGRTTRTSIRRGAKSRRSFRYCCGLELESAGAELDS